jgi:3-hydroxyacyl-[acyl-carrier-protein] dehydratase
MNLLNSMFRLLSWEEGDAPTAHVALNADSTIYRAHFPGNPITPGVCMLQLVGELLEDRRQGTLVLQEVKNLKFVSPLSPVDTPEIAVTFGRCTLDGDTLAVRGTIVHGDTIFAKFSLIYQAVP